MACLAGINYHVWSQVFSFAGLTRLCNVDMGSFVCRELYSHRRVFVRIVCDRVLSQLTSHAIALCVFLFEGVEESLCASKSKPLSL